MNTKKNKKQQQQQQQQKHWYIQIHIAENTV